MNVQHNIAQQTELATVQSKRAGRSPTLENAAAWQLVYQYFNVRLFDGKLPGCNITNTRHRGTLGYFKRNAFADKSGIVCHEISINPAGVAVYGDAEAFGTLAHEMGHLAREEFCPPNRTGKKGARGYHDRQWAAVMQRIGLMPSDTGKPGGKKTGFRVSHYVIEGGPFDIACRELLLTYFEIPWADNPAHIDALAACPTGQTSEDLTPKSTRARFICQQCDLKAWSRYSAKLDCGKCHLPLIAT